MPELLLGDEAVALAAIHAGISGAFSYPGTPATEIFEFIERHPLARVRVNAQWSANEKVAYEEALGMSFAGKRSLVSMKHVGLNVAADPFMSSALTGAHGALVIAVADDPGMHSSQNEQDSRYYGQFAKILVFEPSNQQEAYDMTREAFEVSETFHLPVMVRLVTRLAHSRANVQTRPAVPTPPSLGKSEDWRQWTLLPVNARQRYKHLLGMQDTLRAYARDSAFNSLILRERTGIIMSGLACNYVNEALDKDAPYSLLKIGLYPIAVDLLRRFVDHCEEIFVVEEGYPLIETHLNGPLGYPGKVIRGKCSGTLPPAGELNTDSVRTALGMATPAEGIPDEGLPKRPPQLCQGCPHCDSFRAILAAVNHGQRPYLFSDIGCYTLGALPPHNAIETCVDMGASISMALGAAKAGAHPVVCTIGDSTFIHSGMTGLIGAVHADANMTVVILDNTAVGMTGGQDILASGEDLINIVKGLGVNPEHIIRMEPTPKTYQENVETIKKEVDHRGLSVVVACRPCIQLKRKQVRQAEESSREKELAPQ